MALSSGWYVMCTESNDMIIYVAPFLVVNTS